MNYKPDESTLVAYFYGELDNTEREKVENYLLQNPQDRTRLEEWSFTKKVMAGIPDKEVIAPPIFLGENTRQRALWKESYFRMTMGIAASFLFLLITARILGLSASYSQGEMKIGFGLKNDQPAISSTLTEDQVNQMIENSLADNNARIKASLNDNREELDKVIRQSLGANSNKIDRFIQSASNSNQEQVRTFVAQMQKDNLTLMREYMQLSNAGQKEYIGGLMLDFSKYLEEQRKQDLQLFQVRMNNIEENTDQLKQETSQILTSLINPGSTGPNNTRRN